MVHMGDQLDYGQFVETIHKENSFNVARSSIIEYGGVSKGSKNFPADSIYCSTRYGEMAESLQSLLVL